MRPHGKKTSTFHTNFFRGKRDARFHVKTGGTSCMEYTNLIVRKVPHTKANQTFTALNFLPKGRKHNAVPESYSGKRVGHSAMAGLHVKVINSAEGAPNWISMTANGDSKCRRSRLKGKDPGPPLLKRAGNSRRRADRKRWLTWKGPRQPSSKQTGMTSARRNMYLLGKPVRSARRRVRTLIHSQNRGGR